MIEQKFGIRISAIFRSSPSPPPQVFEADVRKELGKILRSEVGRALAASLRYHQSSITLMPYEDEGCNALEDAASKDSNHSVVLFSPEKLCSGPCASRPHNHRSATLPHEILFHELVHALRRISGKIRYVPLGGTLSQYRTREEFYAILATNIFISDRSNPQKSGLRAHNYGHLSLDKELASSFDYFRQGTRVYQLIANFCSENPGFTRMLSRARALHNPLAAYYGNRGRALEAAAAGDADRAIELATPMDYYFDAGVWKRIVPFPR